MPANHTDVEKRLWDADDELRANSRLRTSAYSVPVLGLIFFRFADYKFSHAEQELAGAATGRRRIGKIDYQVRGIFYLPEQARFDTRLRLTEGGDIGKTINDAMKAVEEENEDLSVLPKAYTPRSIVRLLVEMLEAFKWRVHNPACRSGGMFISSEILGVSTP